MKSTGSDMIKPTFVALVRLRATLQEMYAAAQHRQGGSQTEGFVPRSCARARRPQNGSRTRKVTVNRAASSHSGVMVS